MGLLTGLVTLPLAPVRGVVWLAERVREQAEGEFYDPANIRRQLEEVEEARQAGVVSDEEGADLEDQLLQRLFGPEVDTAATDTEETQ